ncbi:enhancer of mRNA-decapping protein 4 isoform X2 [Hyperolius riggenbachi]|uniref:enhancer of mRNA-decapping protein 4 isoform X2 n=1 Tax=Hyperolius riggenbachi TaxID=752182 RepID=UPI0035A2C46D
MASASSIDVDATQRLRDILKLDRPVDPLTENQLKSSFNGDMNGFVANDKVDSGNAVSADGTVLEPTLQSTSKALFTDRQVICLSGDDSSTFIEIVSKDVEIVASTDSNICSKARGSSKVKIQPVAKYDWEQKYYYGNLIAVSNAYLAYAIRGSNGSAMIRVLGVTTAERILLKGITGSVTDLAFAHLNSNQLACLDEAGSLFVWKLTMEDEKIQDEIVIHIRRPDHTQLNTHRRILWCPYIPEDNEDLPAEDASQNMALLHEDRAEVWDLEIVRANHSSWPTDISDIKEGFIIVRGHSGRLSEGALSPDGTVLATASHDGYVKFWQIYIEGQDQPRCLHEWKPHNGRPVSCLLFCDNHKKQDPDVPFWRFLITGADQNRELKMWCTVSWTCLQTIRFSPDPFSSSVLPGLKVSLDLSAEYLILTDVQRKVLYVMELEQNQDEGRAAFTSISEFLLTHPVLSFGIQDVCRCRIRHTEVLPSEIENDNIGVEETLEADEAEGAPAVLIKLFCVHTKALQDVQIKFTPHQKQKSSALPLKDAHDFFVNQDKVIDLTPEKLQVGQSLHGSQNDLLRSSTDFLLLPNDPKPKLMTPDAFMVPSVPVQQITSSPGTSISSLTTVTPLSSASSSDTIVSRIPDEITLSPKLQLDNSITLSSTQHSGSFPSSPRTSAVLIPGLSDKITPKPVVQVTPSGIPSLATLELQGLEPSVASQASPTRERSPDVISSASTNMSQDIPEIASETLQRSYPVPLPLGLSSEDADASHAPSMSSAASALHLLSALNCSKLELGHRPLEPGASVPEGELISTQSLDEPSSQDTVNEMISQPWPAAPDITRETRNRITDGDHDDEVASLANSLSGFAAKGQSPRLLTKDWTSISPNLSPKPSRKSMKENKHTTQLPKASMHQTSLEQHGEIMALLYSQQRELSELRQNQLELMQRLTNHLEAAQSSIMGHVERVIDTQQEQEKRRMDRILSDEQQRNGQLQDYLSQQLSHSLSGSLSNRLDKTIREEIKKTVPLCVTKTLEPVTGQLSNTIAAKLASVESTLKDSVTKMVKSKNVTDAIGRGVADSLQISIQTGYRESFQSIVLPAFEKGCQSMFQQINHSFQQGTKEYMQQLESHLKNKKANERETWEPLLTQLQQLMDTLQTTTDQLSSNLSSSVRSEVQHQLHLAVGNMQDSILSHVQRIIKEEVNFALKEQRATVTSSIMQAMRSAAGTPIQTSGFDFHSQQTHILQLLQQGNLNQAFQQALTASDLNLILYVCESVDTQQVFGQQPCPLTQPVLLSLIQQLSFDLGAQTELKISYLEEALMHLDNSDPVTRDHMGPVMNQVRQRLLQFLQGDSHNPSRKPARRLMVLLQGLATQNVS